MLLDEATRFFAEHGFSAKIRDLAEHSGVSQGLYFKYFGSKEKLVARVYERTYLQRWRGEWATILSDRDRPIKDRLLEFYKSYLKTVDDYLWIRVGLFTSLSGNPLISQYVMTNLNGILEIIAAEIRIENGDPPQDDLDQAEMEVVWMLHANFIYYLIRKHVLKTPTLQDQGAFVEIAIDNFLNGSLSKP